MHYEVPTLILFRDPHDAIPSYMSRFNISLVDAQRRYVEYYEYALTLLDRVVLVSFDEATENVGSVIHRMQNQTGIDVRPFSVSELEEEVFEHIETWSRERNREEMASLPREQREKEKKLLRESLVNSDYFETCNQVYRLLKKHHEQSITGSAYERHEG